MLAVIDTNVWVSALLNPRGHPAQLLRAFCHGEFTVVMSQPLLEELTGVLSRPRLFRRFMRHDVRLASRLIANFRLVAGMLITLLQRWSTWVVLTGEIDLCRDPHDNMVLETAIHGGANYLVTRDDDLKRDQELIVQMHARGIQIVTVQQFLDILAASKA